MIKFRWIRAIEGLAVLLLSYIPEISSTIPNWLRVLIAFMAGVGLCMEVADYRQKLRDELQRLRGQSHD